VGQQNGTMEMEAYAIGRENEWAEHVPIDADRT
jgi:hypothetical protein